MTHLDSDGVYVTFLCAYNNGHNASTWAVSVSGPGSCFAGPGSGPETEYSLEQTTQLHTLLIVPALLQSANKEES